MLKKLLKIKKILFIIVILPIILFINGNFIVLAQENSQTTTPGDEKSLSDKNKTEIEKTALALNCINTFFSRSRIILAKLAGVFMSNDIIYNPYINVLNIGNTSINIGFKQRDQNLWNMWNFSKTIANLILMFLILYYVITLSVGKNGLASLKKNIVAFLIAGVTINLSRFLIGATLDLVNIGVGAISALPYQLISRDEGFSNKIIKGSEEIISNFYGEGNIKKLISIGSKCGGDKFSSIINISKGNNEKFNQIISGNQNLYGFLDSILPGWDNMSGPLQYLGWSILDILHFSPEQLDIGGSKGMSYYSLIIKQLFFFIFMGFYVVSLFILFGLNLIRIVGIRIFIILSPILIMLYVLKKFGGGAVQKIGGLTDKFGKSGLDLKTFTRMIIKPAEYLIYLSVSLILIVLRKDFIYSNAQRAYSNITGFYVTEKVKTIGENETITESSTIGLKNMMKVTITGLGYGFSSIFLGFLIVYLMWNIMKLGLKGGGMMQKFGETVTKSVENILGTMPIIPVGNKSVSVRALSRYYIPRGGTSPYLQDYLKATGREKLAENLSSYFRGDMDASTEYAITQNIANRLLRIGELPTELINKLNSQVLNNTNMKTSTILNYISTPGTCIDSDSGEIGPALHNSLKEFKKLISNYNLSHIKDEHFTISNYRIIEQAYVKIWFEWLKKCSQSVQGKQVTFTFNNKTGKKSYTFKFKSFSKELAKNLQEGKESPPTTLQSFANKFLDNNFKDDDSKTSEQNFYRIFVYLFTGEDKNITTYTQLQQTPLK